MKTEPAVHNYRTFGHGWAVGRLPRRGYSQAWLVSLLSLVALSVRAFDTDGQTDLVWHHQTTGQNAVWFMDGPKSLDTAAYLQTSGNTDWQLVSAADFNRDNCTDLLWRIAATGQNAIWLMTNTALLSTHVITSGDPSFRVVGTGDFNGDNQTDIVWHQAQTGVNAVWYMNGIEFAGATTQLPRMQDTDWKPAGVGDWNHDLKSDLLWRHQKDGRLCIMFMDGINSMATEILDPRVCDPGMTNQSWQVVATGDFNRMGDTDLVWRNMSNGLNAIWLMEGARFYKSVALPQVTDLNWVLGGTGGYLNKAQLMAQATAVPNQINLRWRWGPPTVEIKKREVGAVSWTNLATAYTPRTYLDTNIVVGRSYEYEIGGEYLMAGIQRPPVSNRGRVLLVVESSLTTNSAFNQEFNRFNTNLVGDGWQVSTFNAARHNDVNWKANTNPIAAVKTAIVNFRLQSPNASNVVFLVGHVPVPYSGYGADDGHTGSGNPVDDHRGAWPADLYYGDVNNELWTDSSAGFTNLYYPQCSNLPGDGKFDRDTVPSVLELGVGRIDFANLPCFQSPPGGGTSKSEVDLLTQYFAKNHRFRHKITPLPERAVGGSFLSPYSSMNAWMCSGATRNASRWFGWGPDKTYCRDLFDETNQPSLFGVMGGFAGYQVILGRDGLQHLSMDLVPPAAEPRIGFYSLHGSWFPDWNLLTNNLMRSLLATPNYGLAAAAYGIQHWEGLGLGQPLYVGLLRSQEREYPYSSPNRCLLGDPTLRLQILAPPSNLAFTLNKNVKLTWNASPEATHYWVFRSTSGMFGTWNNVTPTPITTTSFSEGAGSKRSLQYQVRALKLTQTGSGSFTNTSQGIFIVVK